MRPLITFISRIILKNVYRYTLNTFMYYQIHQLCKVVQDGILITATLLMFTMTNLSRPQKKLIKFIPIIPFKKVLYASFYSHIDICQNVSIVNVFQFINFNETQLAFSVCCVCLLVRACGNQNFCKVLQDIISHMVHRR